MTLRCWRGLLAKQSQALHAPAAGTMGAEEGAAGTSHQLTLAACKLPTQECVALPIAFSLTLHLQVPSTH